MRSLTPETHLMPLPAGTAALADEPNPVLGLYSQNIQLVMIGYEDSCVQALGQLDGETVG